MVTESLPEIPIFQGLNKIQIEDLSEWLERREHGPGKVILREGDPPSGLYVLAKGTVSVLKESAHCPLELARLEGPSTFGELGLLSKEPHSATIRTVTPVVLGWLSVAAFDEKIRHGSLTAYHIAYNLGRIASHRMRAALQKIGELDQSCREQPSADEHMRRVSTRLTEIYKNAHLKDAPK